MRFSERVKQVKKDKGITNEALSEASGIPLGTLGKLLSGFTDNARALLIGTNLGGLGTLIASMASLISYKYIALSFPEKKGKYLGFFTAVNLLFLAVLLVFCHFVMA